MTMSIQKSPPAIQVNAAVILDFETIGSLTL
jgi:hypothetical protein